MHGKGVSAMSSIQELTILGKTIGTYTDWDGPDMNCMEFYKFKPNTLGRQFIPEYAFSDENNDTNLVIDFNTGIIELSEAEETPQQVDVNWAVFNTKNFPLDIPMPSTSPSPS